LFSFFSNEDIFSGRIRAMQLEYTKAHQHLLTAVRKAPQQTAIGFRQNVND
jgi:26S proteasome regulatory subunit N3